MDFRGDPSSALLEVLDPEQNNTFVDHYVEVEYDLSDVMFVATANTMNIPAPLLDRMEVIRLSGYTEDEKIAIAKQYLLPKQMKNNGLKADELHVAESALRDIVRYYTREAGVRSLERDISKICRKVVKACCCKESEGKARKAKSPVEVNAKNLDKYLGVRRFTYGIAEKKNQVGQVTGLAWTEVGGDLLTIEAVALPGKGKTTTTGKLGDVMNESIAAALSVVRHRSKALGIAPDFYQKTDLHIHLPEGATPKDGPSRGRRDRHRDRVDPHRHSGARRRRDDRRDHAARRGAADRRPEGEAAGGRPRRHQDGADPGGEREGPDRDSGRDQEPSRDPSGALDRAGAGSGARAAAGAAARAPRRPRSRRRCRRRRRARTRRRHSSTDGRAGRSATPTASCRPQREAGSRGGGAGSVPGRLPANANRLGVAVNKSELIDAIARHADISKAAAGRALDATVERDHRLAQEGRDRHAGGLRLVLRRQAHRARGPQSAHRRRDQDPRRESAQVPRWQSTEGCGKLSGLIDVAIGGAGTGPRAGAECPARPLGGCLAQLVERRPYKANVGGSIPSAPTSDVAAAIAGSTSSWSGSSVG